MKYFIRPVSALALSIVGAGSLVTIQPAEAFDFGISGQVDRAVTAAHNGEDSDIGFVDNEGSNTRFRFTGDQTLDNGLKLGFTYEIAITANPSSTFDVNNNGGNNSNKLDNRLAFGYVESHWGRLSMGKIDGAANGTSEVNYSGTAGLGGGVDIEDYGSGLTFLDKEGNMIVGSSGDTAILGRVFNEMDALSRQNGVRYDTPSLGGVVLSASLDNGHAYEFAARYEYKGASGMKFGAAGDYLDNQSQGRDITPGGVIVTDGDRFQEYGGSASVQFPIGFVISGSYKQRDFVNPRPTARNMFGGLGWVAGKNHVEVSFDQTDDLFNHGSTFRGYGLAYNYAWLDSLDMYASYHHYTLNDAEQTDGALAGSQVDGQDIDQLYMGFRLKFL